MRMKISESLIKDILTAVTSILIGVVLFQIAKMLSPSFVGLGGICAILGFSCTAAGMIYLYWALFLKRYKVK